MLLFPQGDLDWNFHPVWDNQEKIDVDFAEFSHSPYFSSLVFVSPGLNVPIKAEDIKWQVTAGPG